MAYFDIKRDIEIEKAGGFFCLACVISKPASEQSLDQRYCLGCYEILSHEAFLLNPRNRPRWVPRVAEQAKISTQKVNKVVDDVVLNMATANSKNSEVAIITPQTPKGTRERRGPKHMALPLDQIAEWQAQGLGSKAIASKLNGQGIKVGFRTIARVLSGQRELI